MSEEPTVPLNFVDNPHAPDIFITEASGVFHYQGVVMLTLASAHVNHSTAPGPVNRTVVARLVMPMSTAQSISIELYNFLKSQGALPEAETAPN